VGAIRYCWRYWDRKQGFESFDKKISKPSKKKDLLDSDDVDLFIGNVFGISFDVVVHNFVPKVKHECVKNE
jgi:hypothetical protein